MTEKRLCTKCKHSRGLGYDFWCGEGHIKYEKYLAETDCPYFEVMDLQNNDFNNTENDSTNSRNEKRFTDVWCSETGHIGVTDNGVDKEFTGSEFEEWLNALHEENQSLRKAEVLANHRGDMVSFATALIDDLGCETMQKMWTKFIDEKYNEWRDMND